MTTQKKDYPVGYIRMLLEHYAELADGKWPAIKDTVPIKGKSFKSPYENAIIAKVDIDNAIDSLGYLEREVVRGLNIDGVEMFDMERRFDTDINRVEKRAVRNMAAYLNGECVFNRWCKENGLPQYGDATISNDLPEDMRKYMMDICLKYCVVDECPE